MNHVMLDLETLGTKPGCVIISIGATAFDPATKAIGDGFYTVVNQGSCEASGLTTDKRTVGWWMHQSDDAKKVLVESRNGGMSLTDALDAFSEYLGAFSKNVRIWGCGSDFDNVILSHCYAATGKRLPWQYTSNRCYRTLKALMPAIEMKREGTYHNAYDDSVSQAKHANEILNKLAAFVR